MQGLVVIGYVKQTILIYIVIRNTWKNNKDIAKGSNYTR